MMTTLAATSSILERTLWNRPILRNCQTNRIVFPFVSSRDSLPRTRNTSTTTTTTSSSKSTVHVNVEHVRDEWKSYGGLETYQPGKFHIQCFDSIRLEDTSFPKDTYTILPNTKDSTTTTQHVIMLEGHPLQEEEVPYTVRAIAKCGAGVTNIPVSRMTELGIPVFNTPGANANAVNELILASLFLGSRRIIDGINHMKQLGREGKARERVEKDKAQFGGREIKDKTIAVIGLGHIGSLTVQSASLLQMKVIGFDPDISIESALNLPEDVQLVDSIQEAVKDADYITLVIPYIEGEGGTHGIINSEIIKSCKSDAVILNMGPSELIDSKAMKQFLDNGNGKYITDFPDDTLWDHPQCTIFPHLGGSTMEARDAAARKATQTIREFLETGRTRDCINFPNIQLPQPTPISPTMIRFTIVNKNVPGVLSRINEIFAAANLNIVQQVNQSKQNLAYTIMDIDTAGYDNDNHKLCLKTLQEEITMAEGVLSSRILFGKPGVGYARKIDGKYFV